MTDSGARRANHTFAMESGVNELIRVLHLEDDPRDAELIRLKLNPA